MNNPPPKDNTLPKQNASPKDTNLSANILSPNDNTLSTEGAPSPDAISLEENIPPFIAKLRQFVEKEHISMAQLRRLLEERGKRVSNTAIKNWLEGRSYPRLPYRSALLTIMGQYDPSIVSIVVPPPLRAFVWGSNGFYDERIEERIRYYLQERIRFREASFTFAEFNRFTFLCARCLSGLRSLVGERISLHFIGQGEASGNVEYRKFRELGIQFNEYSTFEAPEQEEGDLMPLAHYCIKQSDLLITFFYEDLATYELEELKYARRLEKGISNLTDPRTEAEILGYVGMLTPEERRAFMISKEGQTTAQIAIELGLSVQRASALVQSARNHLRRICLKRHPTREWNP